MHKSSVYYSYGSCYSRPSRSPNTREGLRDPNSREGLNKWVDETNNIEGGSDKRGWGSEVHLALVIFLGGW